MNMDQLAYNLNQHAKRMSADSLTKDNCYVFWYWKRFITIWYINSSIWGRRFHGFIRKRKDGISIVGLFGISPVLYFLIIIILHLLMMRSFENYFDFLLSKSGILILISTLLLYVIPEIIINHVWDFSKERVINLFQRLSTQEIEKSENQLDSAQSVEQKINH